MHSLKGTIYFDGGCTPNPGLGASAAILIINKQKYVVGEILSSFPTTNNIAEYEALILGLKEALKLGVTELNVFGDAMLVINQVQGKSKTNDLRLLELRNTVLTLLQDFKSWKFSWIERRENREADKVVKELMSAT